MGKDTIFRKGWMLLWGSLLWGLVGCGGNAVPTCTHKPPEPIFKDIAGFENHEFERTGNESVERVDITDPRFNLSIELYQSGCDALRQEFRIIVHEPYDVNTPPAVCAVQMANIFGMLSEQAPVQLGPLYQLGEVIAQNAERMAYNEKTSIPDQGVYLQIDKVHQTEGAILTLVLSQT